MSSKVVSAISVDFLQGESVLFCDGFDYVGFCEGHRCDSPKGKKDRSEYSIMIIICMSLFCQEIKGLYELY